MKQLLEAGVHFGHQTRRWNPKMRRFIWDERQGIYVIDLIQSQQLLEEAENAIGKIAGRGGTVLFVGTKKQAQDAVEDVATRTRMPFVNRRWLGGLLTNWKTISGRLKVLHELRANREGGQFELLATKERSMKRKELAKLEESLGGVAQMERIPDAIVIIDVAAEELAIAEARRCNIPVFALVDTNIDPDLVDYPVPGNDDAMRSITLFLERLGDAISDATTLVAQQAAAEETSDDAPAGDAEQVPAGVAAGSGTDEAPAEGDKA